MSSKVVLVTGGSRGIGRAVCIKFASAGAKVYINYSSSSAAAEETLRFCEQAGGTGVLLPFNVAESEAVDQALDKIKSESGQLDVVVNNAGITSDGLLMRMKDEDWNRVLAINLTGAFYVARAASRLMMKARKGRIINISSIVGEMGNAGQASYVASKAGLIGLTKSMAKELASRNITVNAITPGFIETDMTNDLDEKLKEEMFKNIPLARFGSPEEVAAAVVFLADEHSAYITGQVLGVNGGMYM